MGKQQVMDTIWEVPDELWEQVEPVLLKLDLPKATGRRRRVVRGPPRSGA